MLDQCKRRVLRAIEDRQDGRDSAVAYDDGVPLQIVRAEIHPQSIDPSDLRWLEQRGYVEMKRARFGTPIHDQWTRRDGARVVVAFEYGEPYSITAHLSRDGADAVRLGQWRADHDTDYVNITARGREVIGDAETPGEQHNAFYTLRDIANKHGVMNFDQLRKRVDRAIEAHKIPLANLRENSDHLPNEPKYLFRERSILPFIKAISSRQRPAEKNL